MSNVKCQTMDAWEQLYQTYGITEFMHFLTSSELQDVLLPVKIIFILFSIFFIFAIGWFYMNSSFFKFNLFYDTAEFFSWQPYGLRAATKRLEKIKRKVQSGSEADYKLAIIDSDDLLQKAFEDQGYQGESFEELLETARRKGLANTQDVMEAHGTRNSIVYTPDYQLDTSNAKRILAIYETAIKKVAEG